MASTDRAGTFFLEGITRWLSPPRCFVLERLGKGSEGAL